ncbi:MAG: hypothetical protein Q9170_008041 [Blastenia crenularia]
MSFFGFDTTLPRDRGHPTGAPGFTAVSNPFATFQNRPVDDDDDDDAIDFEDTYDGLGDQLEEANDDFNDDTFGGNNERTMVAAPHEVGKDFDFFGQTAKVSGALNEEQLRFSRHQPPNKQASPRREPSKPYRSGYEAYQKPDYMPDLQVNASLWGTTSQKSTAAASQENAQRAGLGAGASDQPARSAVSTKKMMSLEEVEAAMRAQTKKPSPVPGPQQHALYPPPRSGQGSQYNPQYGFQQPSTIMPQIQPQYSNPQPQQRPSQGYQAGPSVPESQSAVAPHILQWGEQLPQSLPDRGLPQPRQILQNPDRQSAQLAPRSLESTNPMQSQPRSTVTGSTGTTHSIPIITHPQQLMQLSEEERQAFLHEDAKRAKRNHKIYLLSKDNGLMTPQDKNFITRIQLQQLMTATGNTNEQDPDASLSEDFYYQVHNQIRGGMRQNPQQPLSNFAQTYLFQTGSRQGGMARRQARGGDNHMQRMEQQVQRAVEAAKMKPKNKQLIIEGSLGKISFSNAKTPKPLLNIKKQDSDATHRPSSAGRQASGRKVPQSSLSVSDRKTVLKNIENVYSTLMKTEDHERRTPADLTDESDQTLLGQHAESRGKLQGLRQQLWSDLKVLEPIVSESPVLHPFIAFLSYPKGKKAIPRVFRHINQEQRLTILTMIVVHLNVLDVIRLMQPQANGVQPSAGAREEVELFCQAVMPSLMSCINEAPLQIIIGVLGVILDRSNMQVVAQTKVGLDILTTLISRAELIKQAEEVKEDDWEQWLRLYNRLFDTIEPILSQIFPGNVNTAQDVYVWQFLAAAGIGASPDQQQRLVIAVKDRVMETVAQSKTLPAEMSAERLGNVNLFMRAIGLDVELLDDHDDRKAKIDEHKHDQLNKQKEGKGHWKRELSSNSEAAVCLVLFHARLGIRGIGEMERWERLTG